MKKLVLIIVSILLLIACRKDDEKRTGDISDELYTTLERAKQMNTPYILEFHKMFCYGGGSLLRINGVEMNFDKGNRYLPVRPGEKYSFYMSCNYFPSIYLNDDKNTELNVFDYIVNDIDNEVGEKESSDGKPYWRTYDLIIPN